MEGSRRPPFRIPKVNLRGSNVRHRTATLARDRFHSPAPLLRADRSTRPHQKPLAACVADGVINPTDAEADEVCTPHYAYLHDGRAQRINEAIGWHGGEAQNAKTDYEALSAPEATALLDFLNSL